jgi:hypothetical protein|tara:strand:+ start:102 stop:428 length:327 start_codon:yes stop_codon:yes gene_type:complete
MFLKNTNKEVIMKTDKTTEGSSVAAESIDEPLVLKPEWMVDRPKEVEKLHTFSVSFNETKKHIVLTVNGDEYRSMNVRDKLSGMRKFHEGVDKMVKLFSDWGFYENQN